MIVASGLPSPCSAVPVFLHQLVTYTKEKSMPPNLSPDEITLTASPEAKTPRPSAFWDYDSSSYDSSSYKPSSSSSASTNHFTIISDDSDKDLQMSNALRNSTGGENLHPYVQVLSISDLESCVALENAAFPESERCSREKVSLLIVSCFVSR